MPITAQAEKKLRHDRKRTVQTEKERTILRDAIKSMRKTKTAKALTRAFQSLDKAAKHKVIHKNKAARLKSRLVKLLKKK